MAGSDEQDSDVFQQVFRCYPISVIGKVHLENGDKIVMPPSSLERLASLEIDYPILFELQNPDVGRVSHCGVLEFSADEGVVYLPDWMMKNMLLKEGGILSVRNATLPKATFVKLQPHTKDFLDISNPKAILERTLRNFSCLSIGDTIVVAYNNKKFSINVLETKPQNAVSIIETDCEVDFAPPLDYVEPAKRAPKENVSLKAPSEEEAIKEEPKFVPFAGVARRLDGKPSGQLVQPVSSTIPGSKQPESFNIQSAASSVSSRQRAGKLVFGSNGDQAPKSTPQVPTKESKAESQSKEEQKFQAFTGKRYSLMSENLASSSANPPAKKERKTY